MGDRAFTTLLAWPYPGREHLPAEALDELAAHDLLPAEDEPLDEEWYGDGGAVVLAGDQQSGPILGLVDAQANYGVEAFRELITALCAAGLHVYAGNDAGGDYGASWEYSPPGSEQRATIECRRWDRGAFVVSATELLTGGYRTLQEIPEDKLAASVRRWLSAPPAVPEVVLMRARCCF